MGPGELDGQQGAGGRTGGRGSYHLGVMGSRDGPYGVYLLLPAFVEVGWNRIIVLTGWAFLVTPAPEQVQSDNRRKASKQKQPS